MDRIDRGSNFRKIGPFDSSSAYFEALLRMHKTPQDKFASGLHQSLKMMIQYLPPSIKAEKTDHESFVLAHPDLDVQKCPCV
jgi:hypothetical protein